MTVISDLNYLRRFSSNDFFCLLFSIEKTYQALERALFVDNSKPIKFCQKYSATRRIFNPLSVFLM